jgi:N-terminal region of Chorein or VPS13
LTSSSKQFIIGFRKEQVNANLLNGKGEIHNMNLNCEFLNEEISKISPFVELEYVHISKLSFHVSSWTNIKKSPICVDVEEITLKIREPLDYDTNRIRKQIQQITKGELAEQIRQGLIPKRSTPYNLLDRILDNLTVEVTNIKIYFQTWGKFKTRRAGPWMPPEVAIELHSIRFISVNEYGQEAPPDDVWKHNHHRKALGSFLIYKKLEMDFRVSAREHSDCGETDPIQLVSGGGTNQKLEVQLAMERRIKDGECLAMQIDVSIPAILIEIDVKSIHLIVHILCGIKFLLLKDQSFVDPLQPQQQQVSADLEQSNNASADETEQSSYINSLFLGASSSAGERVDDNVLVNNNKSTNDHSELQLPQHSLLDSALEDDDISSSSSDTDIEAGENPITEREQKQNESIKLGTFSRKSSLALGDDSPVLVLPNGLVFHDRVSFSVSVHNAKIRGNYASCADGHVQVVVRGCNVDLIWPKASQVSKRNIFL